MIISEIILLNLYLPNGKIVRYAEKDLTVTDNGVLHYYKGSITRKPTLSLSVDLEGCNVSDVKCNVSLLGDEELNEVLYYDLLDGVKVDIISYDFFNKVVNNTYVGYIQNYETDENGILQFSIFLESEKIYFKVPEVKIKYDSFVISKSGIADNWDKTWQKCWLTDYELSATTNEWKDARIILKIINPTFQDSREYIIQRVISNTSTTIYWDKWKYVKYPVIKSKREARYVPIPTHLGQEIYKVEYYDTTRVIWREGYAGATELNASLNYTVMKNFIPDESEALDKYYPIVYGEVDKYSLLWIGCDYRHAEDRYMLAGHSIYDTTSLDILVYYDLDEETVADEDVNVIGGAIPNPIRVTHDGIITKRADGRFWDDTLGSNYDNSAAASDPLHPYRRYEANFFGYAPYYEGYLVIYGNKADYKFRVGDFRYDATAGGFGLTGAYDPDDVVGRPYRVIYNGYELVNDATDNFNNPYSYIYLKGYTGDLSVMACPRLSWNLRFGLGKSNLYASFRGLKDDSAGSITNIPNSLIENPVDILKHFYLNYTKIREYKNMLNYASFEKARGSRNGWRFTVVIDEQEDGKEIVNKICEEAFLLVYWDSNGLLKVKAIDFLDAHKYHFIENINIYKEVDIKRVKDDIKNNIVFNYYYSWVTDDYTRKLYINKDNNIICANSASKIKEFELEEVELDYIYDTFTLYNYIDIYTKLFSDVYYEIEFNTSKKYNDLELGDIILVTHSVGHRIFGYEMVKRKFIITQIKSETDQISITARTFTS